MLADAASWSTRPDVARWLVAVGRGLFGLALVGLGAEHFVFGEFVTGRAPAWPASTPGGIQWAQASGAALVAIGLAILHGRYARVAAILAAALIGSWALLRHVPVVLAATALSGAWTMAGKALTFTGGALAIAAIARPAAAVSEPPRVFTSARLVTLGRLALGTFLFVSGIQHFLYTAFVASLIPPWFPGDAVFWTRAAGVALIAGGVGLQAPPTSSLAALLSGVMVFSWFWIVHLPRMFVSESDTIAVFEALAVAGIAFVLAGAPAERSHRAEGPVLPAGGRSHREAVPPEQSEGPTPRRGAEGSQSSAVCAVWAARCSAS
jgi:uncharacterized membrane protein